MNYDPSHQQRDLIYKEIELLKREKGLLSQENKELNPAVWPILGTVLAAILAFLSSAALNSCSNHATLNIEKAKNKADLELEKQKHEQKIILLAVNVSKDKVGTEKENEIARRRLEFFMNAGLIPETDKLKQLIENNKVIAISQSDRFMNKYEQNSELLSKFYLGSIVTQKFVDLYKNLINDLSEVNSVEEAKLKGKSTREKRDEFINKIGMPTGINISIANEKVDSNTDGIEAAKIYRDLFKPYDLKIESLEDSGNLEELNNTYNNLLNELLVIHYKESERNRLNTEKILSEINEIERLIVQPSEKPSEIEKAVQAWRAVSQRIEEELEKSENLNERIEKIEKELEKAIKQSPE